MSIRSILALAAVAAMLAGASGCSSHSTPPSITVFVAASLRETFKDLARRFEADNPGTSVVLHFAGSSDLLAQLSHGAVADAFAAGDADIMGIAAHAGLLAAIPIDFASNNLVIVVAPGNPLNIRSFSDLNRDGLSVVACAPIVPCGWAAQRIEDNTGVQLHLMSGDSSVTDVLTKVMNGQADAGLCLRHRRAGCRQCGSDGAVRAKLGRSEHLLHRGARQRKKRRDGQQVHRRCRGK